MRGPLLAAAVVFLTGAADGATLTRGPYLQLLTTRSVTVVWRTDADAPCAVDVRAPDGSHRRVGGARGRLCAVALDGLEPGTAYAYVPLAGDAPLTGQSIFRTDDPDGSFSFLVLGDSGCGCAEQLAIRDRMVQTPADLVVHTGDMVYQEGAAAEFDAKFFRPYEPLLRRLVLWPTLGNHDMRTAEGEPWRQAFQTPADNPAGSRDYYSFDHGNAHFVVLNSTADTSRGSAQRAFLDADLAASAAAWKFVVFHHTIYSSGYHGSNAKVRANLLPVLDAHGVDLVFMGHDHDYERTRPLRAGRIVRPGAGTVYVTTGGGGDKLRPVGASDFTAHAESSFHFVRVAVRGTKVAVAMIRDDGTVGDSFLLGKRRAVGG